MKTITALFCLWLAAPVHATLTCADGPDDQRGIFNCLESDQGAVIYKWSYAPSDLFSDFHRVPYSDWQVIATCANHTEYNTPDKAGSVSVGMPLYDQKIVDPDTGTSFVFQSLDSTPVTCRPHTTGPTIQFAYVWDYDGGLYCASQFGFNSCDSGAAWWDYLLSGSWSWGWSWGS